MFIFQFMGETKKEEPLAQVKPTLLAKQDEFAAKQTAQDLHHNHNGIKDKEVLAFLHKVYSFNGRKETVETWLVVAVYNKDDKLLEKVLEQAPPKLATKTHKDLENLVDHIAELAESNARIAQLAKEVTKTKTDTPERFDSLGTLNATCTAHAKKFNVSAPETASFGLSAVGLGLKSDQERRNLFKDAKKAGFDFESISLAAQRLDSILGSSLSAQFDLAKNSIEVEPPMLSQQRMITMTYTQALNRYLDELIKENGTDVEKKEFARNPETARRKKMDELGIENEASFVQQAVTDLVDNTKDAANLIRKLQKEQNLSTEETAILSKFLFNAIAARNAHHYFEARNA